MIKHANVAIFVPHAGCPCQCSFCNQRHIAGESRFPSETDVQNACEAAKRTLPAGATAQIAFFGGSFTAIEREDMVRLLKAAAPYVKSGAFSGIRVSTRPDAIDCEVLELLKSYGVTTVELGAQSMDDAVLKSCRRGHTARQITEAAALIREAGLSLGLQMMTGLPGDTDEGALRTARALAALKPDEVRVYPTLVIDGSPLAEEYRAGTYTPQTLDKAVELCVKLLSFFEEEQGIPVIRLGLHAEEEMMRHCLAGPWHPAFRELCESRIFREKAENILKNCHQTEVVLAVNPACVSRMVGHRRENLIAFAKNGYTVKVVADSRLAVGEIKEVTT